MQPIPIFRTKPIFAATKAEDTMKIFEQMTYHAVEFFKRHPWLPEPRHGTEEIVGDATTCWGFFFPIIAIIATIGTASQTLRWIIIATGTITLCVIGIYQSIHLAKKYENGEIANDSRPKAERFYKIATAIYVGIPYLILALGFVAGLIMLILTIIDKTF